MSQSADLPTVDAVVTTIETMWYDEGRRGIRAKDLAKRFGLANGGRLTNHLQEAVAADRLTARDRATNCRTYAPADAEVTWP
ncbi:hypothetical protein [Halosegnis longus]|uniref:hypothetical protein n=1 Tax=Halosegnis longus TaxID=2216012 RepID=UPI00129E2F16|nr:hypothetical protein [Halosegnis longus]